MLRRATTHSERGHSSSQQVQASLFVAAPAAEIFALLQDPAAHSSFDGSGTVQASRAPATTRLQLGDRFHMSMRRGVPYRMWSTVVELEPDRRIAWRQEWGRHVWRYELATVAGGTQVTETFDWATCRARWLIHAMRAPQNNLAAIERTLDRLADLFAPRTR